MSCLKEVMKDYRSEVQEVLSADKQLANEIEFDLKRFEEQQKEREEQRRKQITPNNSPQVWMFTHSGNDRAFFGWSSSLHSHEIQNEWRVLLNVELLKPNKLKFICSHFLSFRTNNSTVQVFCFSHFVFCSSHLFKCRVFFFVSCYLITIHRSRGG